MTKKSTTSRKETDVQAEPVAELPAKPIRQTKRLRLIEMLSTAEGSSVAEASEALGWLPHTVRAALTGLRKAGHTIVRSTRGDGASAYSIRQDA